VFGHLTSLISLVVQVAAFLAALWAFIDCVRRRPDAFPAIGRQTKPIWTALTGGAALALFLGFSPMGNIFGIAALVIAGIYLLDIRPGIVEITGGR
jgi:hypothetical protein